MSTNTLKLLVVAVLAVVLVGAILVDQTNTDWAVPLLGLLVGYVIGNAQVTDREGNTAPIIQR